MKQIFLLISCTICFSSAWSQRQPAVLLGESGDGKVLKLMWFIKKWEKSAQGFNIKKRLVSKNAQWQKLNALPIIPELSVSKDLSNVEPDATERTRLKSKLEAFVAQKKVRIIPAAVFAGRLNTDTNMLRQVALAVALDYDMALLNGFGAIDRNTAPGSYDYGLFFASAGADNDEPLAIFNWTYGNKAMLDNTAENITADVMPQRLKLQLKWQAAKARFANATPVGYNVYRKDGDSWIKLTLSPVSAVSKEESRYIFTDNDANTSLPATYALALVTMFANEGSRQEYMYNPAAHPTEHPAPELDEVKSAGDNFKEGFALQWAFPAKAESSIKGFVVEKANLPQNYTKVSSLLPANARSFNENTFSPPMSYLKFRVTALYNDSTFVQGSEQLFYYLPVMYAPKPAHLRGMWEKEGGKTFIKLVWDAKAAGDTLTQGYQLYASSRFDNKLYWENSVPLIRNNEYRYEIFNHSATKYTFCIAAVSKYKAVGAFSDTISIQAPTTFLPTPVIYPYTVDSAKVTLNWEYADVADLKGFRVYQNGNMVSSEYELNKDSRKFITPELQQGATYYFTVKAVSQTGVESEMSIPREVFITPK